MSKSFSSFFFNRSPVFLQTRFNFLVAIAVLVTTVFGWFNENSWCIIALVACRLLTGKAPDNIRTAFSNKLFLAYFLFFLIDAAGYFHTHNLVTQSKVVSKEATMVAIGFALCAGEFADRRTYRQLITAYSLLMLTACLYCLAIALRHYMPARDSSVFFYHTLTAPLSQNAVFFSVYVLCGIVFLLSSSGDPAIGWLPKGGRMVLRYGLVLFFLGMMVLLSSRLLLVITLLILISFYLRRYSWRRNKQALLITCSSLLFIVLLLAVINNPIRDRFREMTDADVALVKQERFKDYEHFSSLELRMLQWRFAGEILNARHAWVFGVSPGDCQDMLDQKYTAANMYVGNPAEGPDRHFRGFLGFNFHNQYLETLVMSGLLGLASLVAIFVILLWRAWKYWIREGWLVVLTIAVLFIPEAPLTMQHGVFFFCFFPILLLGSPLLARISPE